MPPCERRTQTLTAWAARAFGSASCLCLTVSVVRWRKRATFVRSFRSRLHEPRGLFDVQTIAFDTPGLCIRSLCSVHVLINRHPR